MFKVLLIEPHGDDSLCSCSSILRNNNLSIDIVTLGESRDSKKLIYHYPNINRTHYYALPDIDYSLRPKISTHDIHKRFVNNEDVYTYWMNQVPYDNCAYDMLLGIFDTIDFKFSNYDYIVYPLGLLHPYHVAVSKIVSKYAKGKIIRYVDKPYISNRWVKECLTSYVNNNTCSILEVNYDTRKDDIQRVMKDVYPTEVGMFRFSSKTLLEDPDMYVIDSDLESVVNIVRKELFNE